eukprot:366255-Chlamydomonas_euryale.AAC.2
MHSARFDSCDVQAPNDDPCKFVHTYTNMYTWYMWQMQRLWQAAVVSAMDPATSQQPKWVGVRQTGVGFHTSRRPTRSSWRLLKNRRDHHRVSCCARRRCLREVRGDHVKPTFR